MKVKPFGGPDSSDPQWVSSETGKSEVTSHTRRNSPVRVLVVDDSPTACALLVHVLNADSGIEVVGVAAGGLAGVAAAKRLQPDVITMDVHMPDMDGYTATRHIMEHCPTRIVMVTANSQAHEVAQTFTALEAGAMVVLARPLGFDDPGFNAIANELRQTVKLMSEVHVVRRLGHRHMTSESATKPRVQAPQACNDVQLVAMGASTGGPFALQTILSQLPKNFPVPIVIVQHISSGFMPGFVEWLAMTSSYRVKIATDGECLSAGVAYIAPDDMQMSVSAPGHIHLKSDLPENGLRPSVSYLFRSLLDGFAHRAIAVLLTGMGRDGAEELGVIKKAGAFTIAQDRATSVVHGMPGEAVKLGAATVILPLEDIAATLQSLVAR